MKYKVSFTIEGEHLNETDNLNKSNLKDIIMGTFNSDEAIDYYSNRDVDTTVTKLQIKEI